MEDGLKCQISPLVKYSQYQIRFGLDCASVQHAVILFKSKGVHQKKYHETIN